MKRLILTTAVLALLAGGAFAQAPGEDRAPAGAKATVTEKATAKAARKETGKVAARQFQPGDDRPASVVAGKGVSKTDRKAAGTQRKAEGAKAAKEPKDPTAGAGGPSS